MFERIKKIFKRSLRINSTKTQRENGMDVRKESPTSEQSNNPIGISACRNLLLNTPIARNYYELLCKNIVGPTGFALQPKVLGPDGQLDKALNEKILKAWVKWTRPGNTDPSGQFGLLDILHQSMYAFAIAGDITIRYGLVDGNFKISCIDPEFADCEFSLNGPEGGESIKNGIRVDGWGRPLAYFFRDALGRRVEFPASQIIHAARTLRPGHVRGTSPLATVAFNIRDLEAIRAATRTNLEWHANAVANLKPKAGSAADIAFNTSLTTNAGANADGKEPLTVQEALDNFSSKKGSVNLLAEGMEVSQLSPEHPISNYESFANVESQFCATGLGISKCLLLGKVDDTTYSSSKVAQIYDNDTFNFLQSFIIEKVLSHIYKAWLEWVLTKTLLLGFQVKQEDLENYMEHSFIGRSFPYVDPYKDAAAQEKLLENSLTSRTRIMKEKGLDFKEIAMDLIEEKKILDELNQPTLKEDINETESISS